MNPIARFVIRPDKARKGHLLLGTEWSSGLLKPNTIYQIRDILGELTISAVGPGALWDCEGKRPETANLSPVNWGWSVNDILESSGGTHLLTIPELKELVKKGR